jgi:type IV secretion system protein VirB6
MYKGFQTLLGKSKDPIRELIWDLFMKVIAITFALNVDGWLTLVTEAMNGLHSWAGGGVSLFSELDALFEATVKLENALSDKGNMVSAFFYGVIVYAGFIVGSLPALFLIITTTFTLKILILVAPFMFFALMYGWTKNMFTQWLNLIIANTLTVLVVSLILKSTVDMFIKYQLFLVKEVANIDPFLTSIQVLIYGLLLVLFINISKVLAERLAQVSMESAMSSSFGKSLTTAGGLAAVPVASTYMAGKGAYKLGKYLKNRKSQTNE